MIDAREERLTETNALLLIINLNPYRESALNKAIHAEEEIQYASTGRIGLRP